MEKWSAEAHSSKYACLNLETHDSISSQQELNISCGGLYGSMLHAASAHGTRAMVQSLLDHGAGVHPHGIPGTSGLLTAAAK